MSAFQLTVARFRHGEAFLLRCSGRFPGAGRAATSTAKMARSKKFEHCTVAGMENPVVSLVNVVGFGDCGRGLEIPENCQI